MIGFLKEIYYVSWADLRFMRHNFVELLSSSIMGPLLYLLAFGFGLGAGMTQEGVPYIAFIIPGIAALTSLSASFSSTAARLNVQRLYYRSFDEMMMCPLSPSAIVFGKSMLGVVRGMISSSIIFAIGLVLTPELSITPLYVIVILISCFTFSFLGVAAALLAKSHASMATFSSLIVLPMTFLCGTFFSLSNLPSAVQTVLYALPLTHSSITLRAASLGWDFPWISLAALMAFAIAFFLINRHLIRTKKV